MIYYFFDDSRLYMRLRTRRIYGRTKYEGEFAKGKSTGAPTAILKGSDLAPYVMYYHKRTLIEGKEYMALSVAVSEDCVHWQDFPTDVEIKGRQFSNQILDTGMYEMLTAVYSPETEYKYRLYVADWTWGEQYNIKMTMYVSDDGIHFSPRPCRLTPTPTEPFCTHYFNDLSGKHTFIMRPDWGERRSVIIESEDLETYSQPRFLMQPDGEDPSLTELYGVTVCKTEDIFVGLIHLYHTGYDFEYRYNHKMRKGHLEMQLIYSYDGITYQRALRKPFLDTGLPSECDWYGLAFGYCLTERADDFVMTCITSRKEHGFFNNDPTMKISSFSIKKGRFCGLESVGGDATCTMRAVVYRGGDLKLNIEVPYGEARVRLVNSEKNAIEGFDYDDCQPFTGDSNEWIPQWKRPLSELDGQIFSIQVKWFNGILWSLEGNLDMAMTFTATERYLKQNIPPRKLIY